MTKAEGHPWREANRSAPRSPRKRWRSKQGKGPSRARTSTTSWSVKSTRTGAKTALASFQPTARRAVPLLRKLIPAPRPLREVIGRPGPGARQKRSVVKQLTQRGVLHVYD